LTKHLSKELLRLDAPEPLTNAEWDTIETRMIALFFALADKKISGEEALDEMQRLHETARQYVIHEEELW
jgi:hypothetical protein